MSHRLILMHTNMLTKNTRLEKEEAPLIYPPPPMQICGVREDEVARGEAVRRRRRCWARRGERRRMCATVNGRIQQSSFCICYMLYMYIYVCVYTYIYIYTHTYIYIYMYKHGIRCILLCAKLHNVQPHAGTRSTAARMLRTLYYYICGGGRG